MADINELPQVHLKDGRIASLDECTIVYPPVRFGPVIEMQKMEKLTDLVRFAHDRGYGCDSISLTLEWRREELEEWLDCRIHDEFLEAAQRWLDETGGGFAASAANHFWESVVGELKTEFKGWIAQVERAIDTSDDLAS